MVVITEIESFRKRTEITLNYYYNSSVKNVYRKINYRECV